MEGCREQKRLGNTDLGDIMSYLIQHCSDDQKRILLWRANRLRKWGHLSQMTEFAQLEDVLHVAERLNQRNDLKAILLGHLQQL